MALVDSITHYYTGKQVLAYCIREWNLNGVDTPIVLLTHRKEAEWKVRSVRVALSKERRKKGVGGYYGLATSESFPYTHESGYKGEAVILRYEQKKWQKLSHVFDTEVIGTKE